MFATTRARGLERALASSSSITIPCFLLPAFQARAFSASGIAQSQIGRAPLSIPPEVNFTVIPAAQAKHPKGSPKADWDVIAVDGPLGKLTYPIPPFVKVEQDTSVRKTYITVEDKEIRKQREMWGTVRAYLNNNILGVSEGHTAILRLVGVGYRATVEDSATTKTPEFEGQKFVSLKVGYSHPIELPVPKGVTASTPQPTRLLLQGPEKVTLMQFAAEIRQWRRPEPYKGKGIFVNGETIKLKAKKIK